MERMAVVILDIDNFRQFNEMYGRKKGNGSSAPWRIVYRHCCPENAGIFRMDNDRMGILMANAGVADVQMLFADIRKNLWKIKEWKSYKMEVHFQPAVLFIRMMERRWTSYVSMQIMLCTSMRRNRKEPSCDIYRGDPSKKKLYSGTDQEAEKRCESEVQGLLCVNYQPQVSGQTGVIIGCRSAGAFSGWRRKYDFSRRVYSSDGSRGNDLWNGIVDSEKIHSGGKKMDCSETGFFR